MLISEMIKELEGDVRRLLSLNPSRRDHVARYLDQLAGHTPSPLASPGSTKGGLSRWVEGVRSPAQNAALSTYFEETALVAFGQAMLLKVWAERGIRGFREDDIGKLDWELGVTLKPHLPLDREGWQVTQRNLYSWYKPGPGIKREIWNLLNSLSLKDETPSFLAGILKGARQHPPTHDPQSSIAAELEGYDSRFYNSLWEHLPALGLDLSSHSKMPTFFSPTLRDGAMPHSCPEQNRIRWIGTEAQPFQLLTSEMLQLWRGPAAPPLWAQGSGLEMHVRDQVSFPQEKPTLSSRITEMEACDFAWVVEERSIRAGARTTDATAFKQLVDQLPYFKKIREAGTSLGDLQACVALAKLRPGGLLLWAREEPLGTADGPETLKFLLDRSRLLCEWNLSQISHSLPVHAPLFSKYLYLFSRESNMERRLSHRPTRVTLQGPVRSHIEVPLLLGDAMQSFGRKIEPRGQWKIHSQTSPTTQADWAERWPNAAEGSVIDALEELRNISATLSSAATVRATPPCDPQRGNSWSFPPAVSAAMHGFWIQTENRRLVTHPVPTTVSPAVGAGFLIVVPEASWCAPLRAWLESDLVKSWLDHHAERKGEKWVLSEALVKFIPVPKILLKVLGPTSVAEVPESWQKLLGEIASRPRYVRERMSELVPLSPGAGRNSTVFTEIRAALFVRATWELEELKSTQARLLAMVSADGGIQWKKLIEILPKSETVPLAQHSQIQLAGSLPPHTPIGRIERVKAPSPAILLITENGFNQRVLSEAPTLLDIIHDQIRELSHPTWNEISQTVLLPRKLDLAITAATDILRSHGLQTTRMQELTDLLSACLIF